MRLFRLYSYFSLQFFRGLLARVFIILTMILCVYLSITQTLPLSAVVHQICLILVLAFYIVATAGSIIEKTEQYSAELILSKPFTRRDVILADFLSSVTVTSVLTLLLSLVLTLVYGIRTHVLDTTFLALAIILIINFISLYSFIILTGILLKNVAIVTVFWIGYLYVGAIFLEERTELIYPQTGANFFVKVIFDGLYYLLPQIYAVSRAVTVLLSNTIWNPQSIMFTLSGGIAALVSSVYFFNRQELE